MAVAHAGARGRARTRAARGLRRVASVDVGVAFERAEALEICTRMLSFPGRRAGGPQQGLARASRDNVVAPGCARCEDAVVAHEVEAGRRNARGEAFQRICRLEQDVGGAVSPAVLEAIAEPSIALLREPLGGERRTSPVAGEALEAPSIPGGNGDVGMEAEPGRARAARRRPVVGPGEPFGLDLIPEAPEAPAWGHGAPIPRGT